MRMSFVIVVLAAVAASEALAQSRCPAWDSGCTSENVWERMQEWQSETTEDTLSDRSTYDPRRVWDRVENGCSAVWDAAKCGMDALGDSFKQFDDDYSGNAVK